MPEDFHAGDPASVWQSTVDLGHQVGVSFPDSRRVEVCIRDVGEADALATVELPQESRLPNAEWAIAVVEHFDREFVAHRTGLFLRNVFAYMA